MRTCALVVSGAGSTAVRRSRACPRGGAAGAAIAGLGVAALPSHSAPALILEALNGSERGAESNGSQRVAMLFCCEGMALAVAAAWQRGEWQCKGPGFNPRAPHCAAAKPGSHQPSSEPSHRLGSQQSQQPAKQLAAQQPASSSN